MNVKIQVDGEYKLQREDLEKEVEYQIQERENLTKKIEEIQIECAEIREKDT